MGDNIKDLPTDDYPITSGEKIIVEKFFTPIKKDEPINYTTAAVAAVAAFFVMNVPFINNMFIKIIGDEQPMRPQIAKFVICGLIFYLLIKYKIDLKSLNVY